MHIIQMTSLFVYILFASRFAGVQDHAMTGIPVKYPFFGHVRAESSGRVLRAILSWGAKINAIDSSLIFPGLPGAAAEHAGCESIGGPFESKGPDVFSMSLCSAVRPGTGQCQKFRVHHPATFISLHFSGNILRNKSRQKWICPDQICRGRAVYSGISCSGSEIKTRNITTDSIMIPRPAKKPEYTLRPPRSVGSQGKPGHPGQGPPGFPDRDIKDRTGSGYNQYGRKAPANQSREKFHSREKQSDERIIKRCSVGRRNIISSLPLPSLLRAFLLPASLPLPSLLLPLWFPPPTGKGYIFS
jgi:hypothetical protein